MNYETAKKLKDAGFPFREPTCEFCKEHGISCGASYPTLSELIEACGDEFIALHKGKNIWYAEGEDEPLEPEQQFGKTPEEAVANLYLALKGKV